MKLIGKTVTTETQSYEVYDNFPYEWIRHRKVEVTTYWFLFLPIYRTEEKKGE